MRSAGKVLRLIALWLALPGWSGCRSVNLGAPNDAVPPRESPPSVAAESPAPEHAPLGYVPSWVISPPEGGDSCLPPEGFADRVCPLPPCPMSISERFHQEMGNMWSDNKNYYTWPTLRSLALSVAGASILANTSMDEHFRNWYQERVRSTSLDETADIVRNFGDGRLAIPACIAIGLAGALHDDTQWGSGLADFGARTGRAYAVGMPSLLLLQYGLGSTRPGRSADASYWMPFESKYGASGHAFMGAVPFLSAAQMTDDPYLKGCLYVCSVLPAWSRVNDDMHFLSQAWLGWWVAYLACDAVNATQHQDDRLLIAPVTTPEMTGVTLMYRY